ncbi:MAG: hypothetical protein ACK50E_03635 [Bacteroidota bacterium]
MRKILALIGLCISLQAFSLDPNHFTITRISAPYFIVDGNAETTITTAYVGFEVRNTSAVTYSGLVFSISSIGTTVVGQNYTVISPVSRQVIVGTLAPNASKVCYFYVSYPANTTPIASFNVRLNDATATDKTQSFSIRNRSSISANAGGIATQAFANQDALGGIILDTVTYTVGNVRNGDESDFQVAVSNSFDPTKMELISTSVVQSSVPGIPLGSTDSLYFVTGNGSTGATIKVVWRFRIKSFGFTNFLLPCAGSTSGATNYKYQLNTSLGNGSPVTVTPTANPLTITKRSNKSIYRTCEEATFKVIIKNPGTVDVSIDSLVDQLPAGFTYQSLTVSSDVSTTNSVEFPNTGALSALKYVGGVTESSAVSYLVPAGDSVELIYTALAPCVSATNLTTTARGYVGSLEFDNDQNTVSVSATLPVTWQKFEVNKYGNSAKLTWTVSEEQGPIKYSIQKSQTGTGWVDVTTVYGTSVTSAEVTYEYIHNALSRGNNFYRIISTDAAGIKNISKVVSLNHMAYENFLRLYANPVTDGMLRFNVEESGIVEIMNSGGQIIWSKRIDRGFHQIPVSQYSKGNYWLKAGNMQELIQIR